MSSIILLLALLNGNFSDGLNHWHSDVWQASKGYAVVRIQNTGTDTIPAVLCSDAYAIQTRTLQGTADVWNKGQGYTFVGVRYYDQSKARMFDEWQKSSEGMPPRAWHRLTFTSAPPTDAKFVSFCFFSGGYAGATYQARADNAGLKQ